MMYPFMQLNDDTQIVHSGIIWEDSDGMKKETVKVYIEKPIHLGFKTAICYLPDYLWTEIDGFSEDEISELKEIIESSAHLIIRFARQGGIGNASNF